MSITIHNFEDHVDTRILGRGFDYHSQNLVRDMEQLPDGEFCAKVKGTEDYGVVIKMKGEAILQHECGCPYDMGPICKHRVAVLYHLRDSEVYKHAFTGKGKLNTIQRDLGDYSKEELLQLFLSLAKKDRDLVSQLLYELGHEEFYKDLNGDW